MSSQKSYNLNRYQQEMEDTSSGGDFKPRVVQRCKQTHVANKPYAICKFQENILKNFNKWPKSTYFKIEEVI